jgi:hypothetical protein
VTSAAGAGATPTQASYFVEFVARLSTESLPGHTYLVYGRDSAEGHPLERHVVGFYPIAGPVGMVIGIVGFPGEVGEGFVDDFLPVTSRYHRPLTAEQYAKLELFITQQRAERHVWSLLLNNCNDWAAAAAEAIGLKAPPFRAVPPNVFVDSLQAANEQL